MEHSHIDVGKKSVTGQSQREIKDKGYELMNRHGVSMILVADTKSRRFCMFRSTRVSWIPRCSIFRGLAVLF